MFGSAQMVRARIETPGSDLEAESREATPGSDLEAESREATPGLDLEAKSREAQSREAEAGRLTALPPPDACDSRTCTDVTGRDASCVCVSGRLRDISGSDPVLVDPGPASVPLQHMHASMHASPGRES